MHSGFLCMVLAAFFFSIMSLFVKAAGARLPASEIMFARAFVSLLLCWLFLARSKVSPWGRRRGLLLLRGLLGLSALSCFFYALTEIPLADATVIHFTNPVFAALFAVWILGERASWRLATGTALCLAGVFLIQDPTGLTGAEPLPMGIVLLALLGAVFAGAAYVTVRKLRGQEHTLVIVFYFPLVSVPAVLPFAYEWLWPTALEWLLLIGVGVTTQIAQVFLTWGLHRLPAGQATASAYVQVVFAAVWGALLFDEIPDTLAILGATMIIGGAVWVNRTRR